MYAVIDAQFAARVDVGSLTGGLPAATAITEVVTETVFRDDPTSAQLALYSSLSRSTAVLILPVSPTELQIHVENIQTRSSISELKVDVERLIRAIRSGSKNSNQKLKSISVAIYSEDNRVTVGRPNGYLLRLRDRFKDTIVGDILAVATPIIPMYLMNIEREKILFTIATVLLMVGAWLLIESGKRASAIVYEDV